MYVYFRNLLKLNVNVWRQFRRYLWIFLTGNILTIPENATPTHDFLKLTCSLLKFASWVFHSIISYYFTQQGLPNQCILFIFIRRGEVGLAIAAFLKPVHFLFTYDIPLSPGVFWGDSANSRTHRSNNTRSLLMPNLGRGISKVYILMIAVLLLVSPSCRQWHFFLLTDSMYGSYWTDYNWPFHVKKN